MSTPTIAPSSARRWFLARFAFGTAAFGALLGSVEAVGAQTPPTGPRRHEVDDWMDKLPTAHRMVFDAISAEGCEDVRRYASNFLAANRSGYGLENTDIGVIIVVRHNATPLAYADAMWAKYGSVFGPELNVTDPKTQKAPVTNPGNTQGETFDSLSGKGVHFAVCGMATRRFAGMAARASGGDADAVYDELSKNLVRNAHLTPAGIVAVGRAQERGYAFGYAR